MRPKKEAEVKQLVPETRSVFAGLTPRDARYLFSQIMKSLKRLDWRGRRAAFRGYSAHDQKQIIAFLEEKRMEKMVGQLTAHDSQLDRELTAPRTAPERVNQMLKLPLSIAKMKARSLGNGTGKGGGEAVRHVLVQRSLRNRRADILASHAINEMGKPMNGNRRIYRRQFRG